MRLAFTSMASTARIELETNSLSRTYVIEGSGDTDAEQYQVPSEDNPRTCFVGYYVVQPESGSDIFWRVPTDVNIGDESHFEILINWEYSIGMRVKLYTDPNNTSRRIFHLYNFVKFLGYDENDLPLWQELWPVGRSHDTFKFEFTPSSAQALYFYAYEGNVTYKFGFGTYESIIFELKLLSGGQFTSSGALAYSKVGFLDKVDDSHAYLPTNNDVNTGGYGDGTYGDATTPEILDEAVVAHRSAAFSFHSSDGSGYSLYEMLTSNLIDLFKKITGSQTVTDSNYQGIINSVIGAYKIPDFGQISEGTQQSSIQVGPKSFQVSGYRVNTRLKYKDFGTIRLDSSGWQDFNDFVNTRATLYLPFVGMINIDMNSIARGHITLKAILDVYNGNISYWVYTQNAFDQYEKLYGCYDGNAAVEIPMGNVGANYLPSIMSSVRGALSSIVGGAVSGNMGAVASGVAQGVLGAATPIPQYNVNQSNVNSVHTGPLVPYQPRLNIERKNMIRTRGYKELRGIPIATSGTTNIFKSVSSEIETNDSLVIAPGSYLNMKNKISKPELDEILQILADGVYL